MRKQNVVRRRRPKEHLQKLKKKTKRVSAPPEKYLKRRIYILALLCLVPVSLIFYRAVKVQIIGDQKLQKLANRQFNVKVLAKPKRGAIYDRNGKALAINVDTYSLAVNPNRIPKEKKSIYAKKIARALGLPYSKIRKKFRQKRTFSWIKRHLAENELKKLKKFGLVESSEDWLKGIWLVKENKRIYPQGKVASHLVGDVNVDSEGIEGVELLYNDKLRGKKTVFRTGKDALGRKTFLNANQTKDLKKGQSLSLTIDSGLQYRVEQILEDSIVDTQADSGSVIVMNSDTGEILALANYPTYDPNHSFSKHFTRRNRAFTDGYEPGSVIKPLLMAAALSHGWNENTEIWGEKGHFPIADTVISEAEAGKGFEWIKIKEVVKYSSNIGAAKIALKIGARDYLNTLKMFGLGTKTPTEFPGEMAGTLPGPQEVRKVRLANIGFGQGLLVTPIQMIRAFAVIHNGGYYVEPRFLMNPPRKPIRKKILEPEVVSKVLEAMKEVTKPGGTGVTAHIDGYEIAGKTGTAQVIDPQTRSYSKSHYIPSFIGFVVDTEPKLITLTLLNNPKTEYYSTKTSVPLFREVTDAVNFHFGIPKKPTLLERIQIVRDQLKKDKIEVSSAHPAPVHQWGVQPVKLLPVVSADDMTRWKMPDLTGLSAREVIRQLAGKKFELKVRGFGVVSQQKPAPDEVIAENGVIELVFE